MPETRQQPYDAAPPPTGRVEVDRDTLEECGNWVIALGYFAAEQPRTGLNYQGLIEFLASLAALAASRNERGDG